MASTSTLRRWWAPHCAGPWARITLHGGGRVTVRASIVDAVRALNAALVAHAYATRTADTGAYNCRRITGGSGYSLHAYGIAIDINWQSNPYGPRLVTDMPMAMIHAIEGIRTNNGKVVWRWGGRYRNNKDAMHFEIVCSPADIATGIRSSTIPGAVPAIRTPVTPPPARSDLLVPGESLRAGDSRTGGEYRLVFQGDGNLVMYRGSRAVWSTQTNGSGATRAVMQGDGNLVVYAGSKAVWSSKTHGNPGAHLKVQSDGNAVVYAASRALWDRKGHTTGGAPAAPTSVRHTVRRGETLGAIAARYGTTAGAIARASGISNPNLIRVGQTVTVPKA